MTWCSAKMELRKLGRKGKIRMATISHPLTRLALLLRGDEVDDLRGAKEVGDVIRGRLGGKAH
jgi:hypothetical protein